MLLQSSGANVKATHDTLRRANTKPTLDFCAPSIPEGEKIQARVTEILLQSFTRLP
jgi:hypothetical protein